MKFKTLDELFNDPKIGFTSLNKFYDKVKDNHIQTSYKDVKKYYESNPVVQVMRPQRRQKKFSSVLARFKRDIYQVDIMIYDRYKIHNYKYILCVVDVYSRYAEARAMTNRQIETILENFKDIVKSMGLPNEIQSDNEFNKQLFNEYLIDNSIKAVFSDPDQINKNSIVERFNGTLAGLLQKIRIGTNNYNWYKYLPDAIHNYNNTVHSTIKNKPIEIWENKAQNEQTIEVYQHKFHTGDKVRTIIKQKAFAKGDSMKLSKDVHIVEKVDGKKIYLNNIKRSYKPYEIVSIVDVLEKQIEEPKTEIEENKREQLLKREGIDSTNIIEGKRTRK